MGQEANINLHDTITIRLTVNNINLDVDALNVSRVSFNPNTGKVEFGNFLLERVDTNIFEFTYLFDQTKTHEFFVHLKDPNNLLIPTDAHMTILAVLEHFDDQDEIRSIGLYLYFALMASWAIFVYNEGGRKLLAKKKKNSEEV